MLGADEVAAGVLDASVAVRWLVPERGSEVAADLMQRPISWTAPHLLVIEVTAALRRKVVASELRIEQASQALGILLQAIDSGVVDLAADETLALSALQSAVLLKHKVPDCLYLALAQREGAALATADTTLARLAEDQGVAVLMV